MWKHKKPQLARVTLNKKNNESYHTRSAAILRSYSSKKKNAQKQTRRLMNKAEDPNTSRRDYS